MKVLLDGQQMNDLPLGLDSINEVLELDLELHGYVLSYEFPLTFIGDCYQYIYSKKRDNGFCGQIQIDVYVPDAQGTNHAKGFFFLTDCKFNHTTNTCETEITDATYGVFISESKELKISPAADVTRSGEALTVVAETDIQLFIPSTGLAAVTDAKMYELAATVEHQVKFLSDNTLNFYQDFFTGDFLFYLSNHYYIRNRGDAPDIQVSFNELMTQLFKLFGIWFYIDRTLATPTFTLVQGEDNFFQGNSGITFNNVRDLMEEFYPERFFATVNVGDDKAIIERGSTYQLPTVPLVGFKKETYNAESTCALDNTLDLASEWVIDHNKLEYMIITSVTDYEERTLMIYCDSSDNAQQGTYGKTGVMRYYNEEVLNYKVLDRHNIGSSLTQALGTNTDGFKAFKTNDTHYTATTTTSPEDFDDISAPGFDLNSNYDILNYRFICPNTGSYKFRVNLEYLVAGLELPGGGFPGSGRVDVVATIYRRQTGTGTALAQEDIINTVHLVTSGTNVIKIGTKEFFCEATDYVDIDVVVTFLYAGADNSLYMRGRYTDANGEVKGTFFQTDFIFNNGGTADLTELLDYRASSFNFNDYPIPADTWTSLKNNPVQSVYVNNGGANIETWVKKISRNLKTGKSQVELLTSSALSQL